MNANSTGYKIRDQQSTITPQTTKKAPIAMLAAAPANPTIMGLAKPEEDLVAAFEALRSVLLRKEEASCSNN